MISFWLFGWTVTLPDNTGMQTSLEVGVDCSTYGSVTPLAPAPNIGCEKLEVMPAESPLEKRP